MHWVSPFGPQIGVGQLTTEQNDQLLRLCMRIKDDPTRRMNADLVGFVDKEFRIKTDIQTTDVYETIQQSILDYLSSVISIYKNLAPFTPTDVILSDAWCNIQEANEFNPPHSHIHDDVVCVLYPMVDIDPTPRYTRNVTDETPGSVVFSVGSHDARFGRSNYSVSPETGMFLIFPASLTHYTTPTYNETDTRISVSCNFRLSKHFYETRGKEL